MLGSDVRPVIPGRVFTLRHPGTVWLVESGELDIFVAREDAGKPAGALRHIGRLAAGDAAFSLPADSHPELALFASPSPDAMVNALNEDRIPANQLAELMARWISAVGSLEAAPANETLSAFHHRILSAFERINATDAQEELRRLSARAAADGKAVDHALHQLAHSLAPARKAPVAEGSLPPFAWACEEIGKAAGIVLKVPPSVLSGTSPDPALAVARNSSVRVRSLVLKGEWWRQDSGPMLAFLEEGNEPVALLRKGGGYEIRNAANSSKIRLTQTTSAKLSGIGYVFYRPFPARVIGWKDVLSTGLFGSARDVWTVVITGALASMLALVVPFATGILFDSVIPGSDRSQLVECVVLIVVAAVTTTLIGLTRSYALLRLEGKMDFVTQAAVWDRLLNMPTTFFRGFSAGDLAYRSLAISQVRAILTGHTLNAILSGIFSITTVFLLAWYSPALAAVACALASVTVVVAVGSSLLQLKYQHEVARSTGAIASMVFEFIEGIAKFRVSGSEGRAFARWASAFSAQKRVFGSVRRLTNVLSVFTRRFSHVRQRPDLLLRRGPDAQVGQLVQHGGLFRVQCRFFPTTWFGFRAERWNHRLDLCDSSLRPRQTDISDRTGGRRLDNPTPASFEVASKSTTSRSVTSPIPHWCCKRLHSLSVPENSSRSPALPGQANPRSCACCWASSSRFPARSITTVRILRGLTFKRSAARWAWCFSPENC